MSEWQHACTHAGRQVYPYGDGGAGACNTRAAGPGKTVPVGQFAKCEGGFPGLFDMVGNVYEWIDDCDPTTSDTCLLIGGAFSTGPSEIACGQTDPEFRTAKARGSGPQNAGFRCCAD